MEIVGWLLVLLVVALVAAFLIRGVRVVTVHDYERGLRFRRGRLAGLVDPGTHVTFGPLQEVRALDARPTMIPVEGQEVLTADGVAAKISLVARYEVGDPVAAFTRDTNYDRTLYLLLQLGLRDVVTRRTLEETLAARAELGPEIRDAVAGRLADLGIELLEVQVRDVMLPGELKRAYASVLTARKEGEAALERAHAETAALRSLANAGRTVADNPGLLQLRILQELGASTGNTVVFGAPDAVALPQNGDGTTPRRDAASGRKPAAMPDMLPAAGIAVMRWRSGGHGPVDRGSLGIIPAMTERGLPAEGAPACPFVAFEDDRDGRSTAPDHRHRCFAEPRPAPRALAHQEAYCLSSAFPVCPTFQDWARREAAAARPSAPSGGAPRDDPPQSRPMPPLEARARSTPPTRRRPCRRDAASATGPRRRRGPATPGPDAAPWPPRASRVRPQAASSVADYRADDRTRTSRRSASASRP